MLLSNMYAAAGRWDDVAKVRTKMKDKRLKMTPGCTLVEINNRVYQFIADDRSHPHSDEIYSTLESLAVQMKDAGYVPNTSLVLHDVAEEVKERMLWSHSEKLAILLPLSVQVPGPLFGLQRTFVHVLTATLQLSSSPRLQSEKLL